ncbi:unnamed protein product [Closterium sp. NIES-53]
MATQCAAAVRRELWEHCGTAVRPAGIADTAIPCAIDHSPQPALRPSTDTPTDALLAGDRLLPFVTAPLDAEYAVAREEMGRGEFGVVRACMARRSGQLLACKSVEKARLCGERRGDLEMELLCMAVLPPHPHVVRLASVHEDARRVHLVMDLCDGGDLFDLVARAGRLPERCAAAVLAQAASAVAWCHAHGVLHLDVKPENLLLAGLSAAPLLADARSAEAALAHVSVKLADFGQAVAVGAGGRARGLAGSSLYMAPEVVCGREYDSAADMWSVGVVLYVMLAGYVPFYGPDLPHVFLAICRGHPDLTGEPWEGVSDEAKQLVRTLLSADPAARPSACDLLSHPWLTAHAPAAAAAVKAAREAASAAVLAPLTCASPSGASTTPVCPSLHAASPSSSLQSTAHLVQVEAPTGHYECIKPEEQATQEGQQRQAGREEGMREATHKLQASHGAAGKPHAHETASEASLTAQQHAAQQQGAEAAHEARSGLTGMLAGIREKMGHTGEVLLGGLHTTTEESSQAAREGATHTPASAGVPAGQGYEQGKQAPDTASAAAARGAGTAAAAARGAGTVAGTVQGLAEEGGAAGKRGVEGAARGAGTTAGVVQGAAEEAGHAAREGSKAAVRGAGSVAGVVRGEGEEAGKAAREGSQAAARGAGTVAGTVQELGKEGKEMGKQAVGSAARGAGTVAGTVQALGEEGREVGKQAIGSAARGVGAVGGTAQAVREMAGEAASEGLKVGAREAGEVYGTVQGAADVGSHVASDVGQQVKCVLSFALPPAPMVWQQGAQVAAQGAARGVGTAAGVVQGAGEAAGRAAMEGRREVGDAVGAAGVGTAEAAKGVVGGAAHAVGTAASAVGGGAYDTVEGVGQAIGGLGLTVAGGVQSMLGGVGGAVGGGLQSLVDSVRGVPHSVGEAVQGHAQQVQAEGGSGGSGTEGKGAEDVISRRVDVVEGMRMGGEDIAGIVGSAVVPAGDTEGVEGPRVIVVTEDKVVREGGTVDGRVDVRVVTDVTGGGGKRTGGGAGGRRYNVGGAGRGVKCLRWSLTSGGLQSLVDSVRGVPHSVGEAVQGHAQQVQAEGGSGGSGTEGKGAEDVISRRVDVVEGMRMGGEDIAGIVGSAVVPAGDTEGVEGLRVIVVTEDKVVRE